MSASHAVVNGRARHDQRFQHVIAAEALKAVTLRTPVLLWLGTVAGLLVGTLVAVAVAALLRTLDSPLPDGEVEALIGRAPVAGAPTAALLLGLAGVFVFGSERSSGRERITALEVPVRLRVFSARLVVSAASAMAVALVGLIVCAAVSVLVEPDALLRSTDEVARLCLSVVVVALATVLVAHLGACLGALVPHGVVAAGTYVALIVVVPPVLAAVGVTPGLDAVTAVAENLPAARLGDVVDAASASDWMRATVSLGVLGLWVAGATVISHVSWNRGARLTAESAP